MGSLGIWAACHVVACVPSCYLDILDELQKGICGTFGPSFAVSLEPFAVSQNVASSSLFYGYYFGRCSSELAELAPLFYPSFLVTIPRCYKDVYVNSPFPHIKSLEFFACRMLFFDL